MFDWFISDLHFRHANIIKFEPKVRPFDTVEEHDEHIIAEVNKVVGANDTLLVNGDCAFNVGVPLLGRLNGRKLLCVGNHEHKNIREYLPYFEDAKSVYEWKGMGVLFSHIPVHPCCLEFRWKVNVHVS